MVCRKLRWVSSFIAEQWFPVPDDFTTYTKAETSVALTYFVNTSQLPDFNPTLDLLTDG